MNTKLATLIFVIVATAVIIGYDIFIAIEPTPDDTISAVLLNIAGSHPIIAWCWGGLGGHLFWPMKLYGKAVSPVPFVGWFVNWRTYRIVALSILILITISLLVLDITSRLPIHPALLLAAGIPAWHWGWPQMKAKWRES